MRAQISRIIHSTTLFPKGLMRKVEDEERKIEQNDPEEGELVMPTTSEMQDKSMWVHACPSILLNCRTIHPEPEESEEKSPEELKEAMEKADPFEPLLKPITDDE